MNVEKHECSLLKVVSDVGSTPTASTISRPSSNDRPMTDNRVKPFREIHPRDLASHSPVAEMHRGRGFKFQGLDLDGRHGLKCE
jgi:hypothetical protein